MSDIKNIFLVNKIGSNPLFTINFGILKIISIVSIKSDSFEELRQWGFVSVAALFALPSLSEEAVSVY